MPYYRLKIKDRDGKTKYVTVKAGDKATAEMMLDAAKREAKRREND